LLVVLLFFTRRHRSAVAKRALLPAPSCPASRFYFYIAHMHGCANISQWLHDDMILLLLRALMKCDTSYVNP
jgi:hypothetical protein